MRVSDLILRRALSLVLALGIYVCLSPSLRAETRLRVAMLDAGDTRITREIEVSFKRLLESSNATSRITTIDVELARAASRGAGYAGSLNLTLAEARDLGTSIGCDFFLLVFAETIRCSSFVKPVYYEAGARVIIVSARTGKLVAWDYIAAEDEAAPNAERAMLAKFAEAFPRYRVMIFRRAEDEARARAAFVAESPPASHLTPLIIDDAPPEAQDEKKFEGEAKRLRVRPPQPYRRPRPAYPERARRAGAEATIDVEVDVLPDGSVGRVEVVRWGGFGLDETVTEMVGQMYFRPAMRDGVAVLSRVLLRYNFLRPAAAPTHATSSK